MNLPPDVCYGSLENMDDSRILRSLRTVPCHLESLYDSSDCSAKIGMHPARNWQQLPLEPRPGRWLEASGIACKTHELFKLWRQTDADGLVYLRSNKFVEAEAIEWSILAHLRREPATIGGNTSGRSSDLSLGDNLERRDRQNSRNIRGNYNGRKHEAADMDVSPDPQIAAMRSRSQPGRSWVWGLRRIPDDPSPRRPSWNLIVSFSLDCGGH